MNGFMATCKETGMMAVSSISTYDITADVTEKETVPSESLFPIEWVSKNTEDVCRAIGTILWRYRRHVHTITADNGTEFCAHESVAKKLQTDVYFAHPYASWERGLNENFNGLLRQYIPKGTCLSTITDKEIAKAQRSLKLRPRKCLGYRQPAVVFD